MNRSGNAKMVKIQAPETPATACSPIASHITMATARLTAHSHITGRSVMKYLSIGFTGQMS